MTQASTNPARRRATRFERAVVLAGFAVAGFYTVPSLAIGAGTEAIGPLWLAAILWTVFASLACALRRGIRRGDWSAFTGYRLPRGQDERIDAATGSGRWLELGIAEDNERLMRGD